MFAVLSYVTPKSHARSAGIVYTVRDRVLYIGTGKDSWKAKHIVRNPNVALFATNFLPAPRARERVGHRTVAVRREQ